MIVLHRMRGLNQLLRSKSIMTVGQLCALSEYDIHHLPLRSPKVDTLRTVLTELAQKQGIDLSKGMSLTSFVP